MPKRTSPAAQVPRRSVLSDETYDTVKAMIMSHKITPGQKVNIDALSKKLRVSQTPIREALARLESDGLIEKVPLKGYTSTPLLTLREFDELFQFRLLIEPWAAELAAKRVDSVGQAALEAELQSARTALKFKGTEKVEALTEHDSRFHLLITKISGNYSVIESFERSHCHLHLFRLYMASQSETPTSDLKAKFVQDLFKHYYQANSGGVTMKEHEAIAAAIIAKNGKSAKALMQKHIQQSLKRFSPAARAINA
jgi:DNA-binding GntR family transcriptional regulator